MDSKRFPLVTLGLALVLMASIVAINLKLNLNGLFGDAKGLERVPGKSERVSKYLFGFNYIPANFDAVLLGNSVAEAFLPADLHGFRVYNLAVGDAAIVETRRLAENAMDHGNIKLVILGMHPALLRSREGKVGSLTRSEWFGALGSRRLFEDYGLAWWKRRKHVPLEVYPDGHADHEHHQHVKPRDADVALKQFIDEPVDDVAGRVIDDGAVEELQEFLAATRARGVRIAVFFPPVYAPMFAAFRDQYQRFYARVKPLFHPGEIVLDFNDGTHLDLTADKTHYVDGIHLNNVWAHAASRTLDDALQRSLAPANAAAGLGAGQ